MFYLCFVNLRIHSHLLNVIVIYTESKDLTLFSLKQQTYLNTDLSFEFNNSDFFVSNYTLYRPDSYDAHIHNLQDSVRRSLDWEMQESNVAEHFTFLRQATITSFFIVNMVDMPVCFKKSKSLYSKTFEIPLLKLSNILMRAGQRGKTMKAVSWSFTHCFHQVMHSANQEDFISWRTLHGFLLATLLQRDGSCESFTRDGEFGLIPQHRIKDYGYTFNSHYFLKNFLFERLEKYAPLFSFYIRKVDKSVRKNSRGKSGKYMVIWKYVPVYKRLYVNIRWLLRDLKFQKFKTFPERLTKVLETFLLTPHMSFVCKLRRFTHTFVFRNYKKSLLKTLKATS